MKRFSLFLLTLILFTTVQAQDLPDDPRSYYDFWVGEWELTWTDQNGQEGTGTNHIEKIMDGTVIQEHFEASTGQLAGFKGSSLSVYNPNTGWHQAWADNTGGYLNMQGSTDGNKRIFQTGERQTPNGKVISRMVFYNITDDSLTWDWESSSDKGESWTLNWRIHYIRR